MMAADWRNGHTILNRLLQRFHSLPKHLMVTRCVCTIQDGLVPVRLANPNQWDVKVHHGMRLAQLSGVAKVPHGEPPADQLELGINEVKVSLREQPDDGLEMMPEELPVSVDVGRENLTAD